MGRIFLIGRLAVRDLQRRRAEALMVLVAIIAATTTLTLGLALRGVTSQPYLRTRVATAGPDVVASWVASPGDTAAGLAQLKALEHAQGVGGHGGPYPLAYPVMRAGGYTVAVIAEGRDAAAAAIDQPELTAGSWVGVGGVVVERSFAEVLGLQVGERVTVGGRAFRVSGIAVTAAIPPYPMTGFLPNPSGNPA